MKLSNSIAFVATLGLVLSSLSLQVALAEQADGNAVEVEGSPKSQDATLDKEESAFLGLINEYRAQNGLSKLTPTRSLNGAAHWMSADMATYNYFDHEDRFGRSPFDRMAVFLYKYNTSMAENIAAGNSSAKATFVQWKNSPGHNKNMLGKNFRAIGIARAYNENSTYRWYWTTDFGGFVDK